MKRIQIFLDETLLEELDHEAEVQRVSRSAIVRTAVVGYLASRDQQRIPEKYRLAYEKDPGLGDDFEG